MIRVAVANEYNLRANVQRFHEGRYARHLLFGVQRLVGPDLAVRMVGESLPGPFHRSRRLRVLVTNLRAVAAGRDADVVYATSTFGAVLAGFTHQLVGRPRRVVTLVHGLPAALRTRPALFGRLFAGHDTLAFLSPADLAAVRPALRPGQHAFWIPWGPSQDWGGARRDPSAGPTEEAEDEVAAVDVAALLPPVARDGRPFAFAIGKSKRDWDTLAAAQRAAGFPLVVVAGPGCPVQPGDAVAVHVPPAGAREALSLAQVQALYRAATVHVLPLVEDASLNGLTALGEALASGSVVVMSATTAMGGFAAPYPGWVVPVPPGDAAAMGAAVAAGLAGPPPAERVAVPTAERFEEALLAVLRGDEVRP